MPTAQVDGERITSTAGLLHDRLAPLVPGLEPGAIHRAAREAWRWAETQRGPTLSEVPAPRRFRHLLGLVGLADPAPEVLADALDIHFRAIRASLVLPPEHRALLEHLRGTHRLALFSNFDHGPALQRLLEETGLAPWLDPILISDGLGYRKPGVAAFARALAALGERPEHVLFVGDSLADDVAGAHQVGLDVAWLNRAGDPLPEGTPHPTYTLDALDDLAHLLDGER